jgi:Tol biopolymer transport system component
VAVGGDNAHQPWISRRGNRLAFVKIFVDLDTWEIEMSGSPPRARSPRKVISSSRSDAEAQLSPDGSKIAFDSDTEGQSNIYVLEVAGGVPRRLTTEASSDVQPSWSGDGRWIYFGSNRAEGWQLWKVPVDGGPALQVTRKGGFVAFESPDGSQVYYAKFEAPGIWTVPVDGGEERMVHDRPPSGNWDGWGVGRQGLYVVNREAKPRPAIELFSLATRRVTRVTELERQATEWLGFLTVSRDERSILFSQSAHSGSDIVMVEGFR